VKLNRRSKATSTFQDLQSAADRVLPQIENASASALTIKTLTRKNSRTDHKIGIGSPYLETQELHRARMATVVGLQRKAKPNAVRAAC